MAVCIAFVRSQSSTSAWTRCARPTAAWGGLCAEHRDSVDGALLGMLGFEEPLPPEQAPKALEPKKRSRKSRKRSSPAWDTRNVAAATTTPERLEPDPARACPAPTLKDESGLKTRPTQL
jgi:hypothetical protein